MLNRPAEYIIWVADRNWLANDWHGILKEWCIYMHDEEAKLLNSEKVIAEWEGIARLANQVLRE